MTSEYERYAADAAVLAQIGRAVFSQPTRVSIRLPRALADLALAAWARDETGTLPGDETPERIADRHRAGTLGLIGLSVEQATGGTPAGDDMVIDLDAWDIGSAFDAAEDAGLLTDVRSPDPAATDPAQHPVHLYAVLRAGFSVAADKPEAHQRASSLPVQFDVVVERVVPTAELASNEVRRLNALNQDKHCTYFWQITRYYSSDRKAQRL